MQLIFDNLVAVLIASVMFLILVGVNHRSRQSAVETSSYYALKQHELNFVETLKRDLQNVTNVTSITEDPSTHTYTFWARTNPADTTRRQVTYRRVYQGEQDGLSLYQVQRIVAGTPDGGSVSTIVDWQIVSRNAEGIQVTNVADTRQIFVRFEAINPFNQGETIDRSRWEATFRPPLLQQATSI